MPKRKRDEESGVLTWVSDTIDSFVMRRYPSIHLAVQAGNLSAVRAFLKHGTDINLRDDKNHTPLYTAVFWEHIEIARFLIEEGADINPQSISIGHTPLHIAAGRGYREIADLLIKQGADVNKRNAVGDTPLHMAARRGCIEIMLLLIEKGVDVNAIDIVARTPIMLAAENGRPNAVRLLQQHGAVLPEGFQINAGQINNGQSVHTVSVHENVSKSALILQNHYQLSAENIAEAHRELTAYVDKLPSSSDKPNAAKRGLARLSTLDFIDERSGISLHEAMALVWKGLTDPQELMRKRKERGLSEEEALEEEKADLQEAITDWLYETQRNYNVSESGIDDQAAADQSSCTSGSFNISLYALNGRHSLVNIPVVNEAYIAAQVPILANQAFDDLTDEERAEYVKGSRDEISPALLTRLRQLIEPALHEKFDEFNSDGLPVNKIIQDALASLEYIRILRLENIQGKQEKEEKQEEDLSPTFSPSSSM